VRHRTVVSWPLALTATVAGAFPLLLIDKRGPQLAAPLIASVISWLGTIPIAAASWLLVERPIMPRARLSSTPRPADNLASNRTR